MRGQARRGRRGQKGQLGMYKGRKTGGAQSSAPAPRRPASIVAAHSAGTPSESPAAPFALDERSVPVPAVEPDTVAATAPIVGLGADPSLPFIAVASEESVAKPTDAGFARKTE